MTTLRHAIPHCSQPPTVSGNIMNDRKLQKTVIVVEYDEISYILIQECLKEFDFLIYRCYTSGEIVELIKKDKTVALVFLDIYLKDNITGFDLVKLLKDLKPNLPIVFQTAYVLNEIKSKCFEVGCDYFLPKPYNLNEFKEVVRKYAI